MNLLPPYTMNTVLIAAVVCFAAWFVLKSYRTSNWQWVVQIIGYMILPFYLAYRNAFAILLNVVFVLSFFALPILLVLFLRFIGLIA